MQTPKSRVYVLLDSESRVLRLEGEYSLPVGLKSMKAMETSTRSLRVIISITRSTTAQCFATNW